MSIIPLQLPPQVKVLGALRTRSNVWELDQDMLAIELPNRIFIAVGWYPDCDPKGEYRMMIFKDTVDHPIEPTIRTKDFRVVKSNINRVVKTFTSPIDVVMPPLSNESAVKKATSRK